MWGIGLPYKPRRVGAWARGPERGRSGQVPQSETAMEKSADNRPPKALFPTTVKQWLRGVGTLKVLIATLKHAHRMARKEARSLEGTKSVDIGFDTATAYHSYRGAKALGDE